MISKTVLPKHQPVALENYDILDEIHASTESTVHRITCRRGRLRGRQLALKQIKIPSQSSSILAQSCSISSTPIHQALHHPNIVTLYSVFLSPPACYHILELCSSGCLSEYLNTRYPLTLPENEFKRIFKGLTDALLYLRKEAVVHRNINPSNILLTGDNGVKLSDFKYATRLSPESKNYELATPPLFDDIDYASPEILSGSSYSFSTDIWSLGCVAVNCLLGNPPFKASAKEEAHRKIADAEYFLPANVSTPIKNFVNSCLQQPPESRILVSKILSHPFFSVPILGLSSSSTDGEDTIPEINIINAATLAIPSRLNPLPPFPSKVGPFVNLNMRRKSYAPALDVTKREKITLGDIGKIASKQPFPDVTSVATRRVVSDPIPGTLRELASQKLDRLNTQSERDASVRSLDTISTSSIVQLPLDEQGEAGTEISAVDKRHLSLVLENVRESTSEVHKGKKYFETDLRDACRKSGQFSQQAKPHTGELAAGVARPSPLNTFLLTPKTHKSTNGHITILPSRSLLIDFRESHRRHGLTGNEVLITNAEGTEIKVYSAPHLSSPCCLVEPIQEYRLSGLPPVYWKEYNDAAEVLDQIKRRTPRLVEYATRTKCTLMANDSPGDIEILIEALSVLCSNISDDAANKNSKAPRMRLRFSRQRRSVEIARYTIHHGAEEWTKKVIPSTNDEKIISPSDWARLEAVEQEAAHQLRAFVRTCQAVETVAAEKSNAFSDRNSEEYNGSGNETSPDCPLGGVPASSMPHIANGSSLSNTCLPPSKVYGVTTLPQPDAFKNLRFKAPEFFGDTHIPQVPNVWISHPSEASPSWSAGINPIDTSPGIQARFIPSVGWCIRYNPSKATLGGRYRMMFFDGANLEVDIDEEMVIFTETSGGTVKYHIRDCSSLPRIAERMKVFEVFVSLFEENSQSCVKGISVPPCGRDYH